MKYTLQNCCDKTMDDKWPYVANVVFRIVQNHGEQKLVFEVFGGGDPPIATPLVPPLM